MMIIMIMPCICVKTLRQVVVDRASSSAVVKTIVTRARSHHTGIKYENVAQRKLRTKWSSKPEPRARAENNTHTREY